MRNRLINRLRSSGRRFRGAAAAFDPRSISGHIGTWEESGLGADASAVASWTAIGGVVLSQGTGASQPTVGTASGKKYALGDGTDDLLTNSSYTQTSAAGYAVAFAFRMTASPAIPIIWQGSQSAGIREVRVASMQVQVVTNTGAGTVTDPSVIAQDTDYVFIVSVDYGTDAVTIYRNGTSVQTGTDNTNPAASPANGLSMFGRFAGSLFFPARIYSLSYYERAALSAADVANLYAYHRSKMP